MTENYLDQQIGYQVQNTAYWRRQKAEQFPQDTRNLVAAEQLDRLGAEIEEIGALTGYSEIERQISDAEDSIHGLPDDASTSTWGKIAEAVSDELRAVGFWTSYSTGQELLEWYRDLLLEKLHDEIEEAIPAPDLDEQIEDDPTVKAAKLAYDEARAKALAEARKTI